MATNDRHPQTSSLSLQSSTPKPHTTGKDARRAFEHLGRVRALGPLLPPDPHLHTLLQTANQHLQQGAAHSAAELLRTAEHLGFGLLKGDDTGTALSPGLLQALTAELAHLREKAETRLHKAALAPALHAVHHHLLAQAAHAESRHLLGSALEYLRGAEALTHLTESPDESKKKPAKSPKSKPPARKKSAKQPAKTARPLPRSASPARLLPGARS